MLGNESRNRGDQRLGVQTTIGTLVDNGDIDNNDGNGRRHRSKSSISHVGSSGAVAVSQADFEEKFLQIMSEHRIAMCRILLKKKFIDLSRKYQDLEISADDMTTQVQAQQTDLYPFYHAYFLSHGISAGTVIRCACSTVDRSGDIHEHFVFTHNG